MHALLFVIICVAPAFLPEQPRLNAPVINLISARQLDTLLRAAEVPTPTAPAPALAVPASVPVPAVVNPPAEPAPVAPPKIIEPPKHVEPPKPVEKTSPPPVPKAPKTLPKPDTVKDPTPKATKPDSRNLAVTPKGKEAPAKRDAKKAKDAEPEPSTKAAAKATTKPAIKIADTSHLASRRAEEETKAKQREQDEERAQERAQALAAAKAAQQAHLQRVAKMNSILGGIQGGLSSPVDIHIDAGSGPNALAFLDYGQMMVRIYEQAWLVPPNLSDSLSVVGVTVTVARNGRVLEWRLAKPSGNSAVDKSVRETLQKVIQFDPFPASFRESQRTFNIDFNLKAKRTTG